MATVMCGLVLKDFVMPKISRRDVYVVCPGVDMCNHSNEPNARVEFEVRKHFGGGEGGVGGLNTSRSLLTLGSSPSPL